MKRLRHRLMLDLPTHLPDDMGGQQKQWTQSAILWGEVRAPGLLEGLEVGDAGQEVPRSGVVIRVRRRASLAPGQRLRWGERIFLLRAIRDDGISPYVELLTEES
jgi:head-tail adaptor